VRKFVAEQIRDKCQKDEKEGYTWHIGLKFSNHVGLDLDKNDDWDEVMQLAQPLADMTNDEVGIFASGNGGFWVIAHKDLTPEEYKKLYGWALSYHIGLIDIVHTYLSIKYAKTTFRLDEKDGKSHSLVEVVMPLNPTGIQLVESRKFGR
jgi:hypothetical protein